MKSNEGRPVNTGTQDDYEATVLAFLDKEMSSVQQAQKPDPQSDELDALVTDLLKQVVTETDQTQSADKPLFDEDELFAGLTTGSEKDEETANRLVLQSLPSSPSAPMEIPLPESKAAAEKSEPSLESAAVRPVPAGIFGSNTAASARKLPVKAIAAFVGLAVIVGGAAYFFSSKSAKAPKSQPAAQITKSDVPAMPAQVQPENASSVTPEKSPARAKSSSTSAPRPSPAAPVKPTAQPASQPVPTKPSTSSSKAESAQTASEEKTPAQQASTQPTPAAPAPAPAAAAVEKPTSQPVTENAAPAAPEKKPVPPPPAAAVVNEPPSPAPAPAPAAPVVSGGLTQSIPISQASPVYPELALRTRASGQVVLELQIDSQGRVVKATAVSGPAIFYNAAIAAALKWRYKPASINGVNVASQSRVTMTFNLKR